MRGIKRDYHRYDYSDPYREYYCGYEEYRPREPKLSRATPSLNEVKKLFAAKNPQTDGEMEQRAAIVRYRVETGRKQEESLVDKMEKWLREGSEQSMKNAIANLHKLSNEELYLVFFRIYQDRKKEFRSLDIESRDLERHYRDVSNRHYRGVSNRWALLTRTIIIPLVVTGMFLMQGAPLIGAVGIGVFISLCGFMIRSSRVALKIEKGASSKRNSLKALKKLANGKKTNITHITDHARYMLEDGTPLFVRAYERRNRRAMELLLLLSWKGDLTPTSAIIDNYLLHALEEEARREERRKREEEKKKLQQEDNKREEKFHTMCEALVKKFEEALALGNYEKALEIAKSWNPQTVDKEGRTLMHYAFMQGEYTPEFSEFLEKMESLGYNREGPLDVYGNRPADYDIGSVLRFREIERIVEQKEEGSEEESEEKAAVNVSDNSQAQHDV